MLLNLTHGFLFLDFEHYSSVAMNSKNSLVFQNSNSHKCGVMMFLKVMKDDFFPY